MSKRKGFITERINFYKKALLTVKAEEPTDPNGAEPTNTPDPNGAEPPKANTVNFEDLIAKARKQEKEKLYPQIKKLEEEKTALIEKNNNNLLALGEKDSEIAELKKQLKEAQDSTSTSASEKEKTLQAKVTELEKKLTEVEANTVSREEIEAEIKGEYEVKLYREQKLRELGDTVIPELITGATKEDIDASITVSQQRFQQIQERVLGSVQVPVGNVSTSSFQNKDLKVEDIVNLDPRSPEYAQLRAKLGLK